MNVALSTRHTVHATRDGGSAPKCLAPGHKGAESYQVTTREVTCKKCLKVLAAEAEAEAAYQDRLAASMMPATEWDDLGYVAPAGAEDEQPEEIREIREAAEAEAQSLRDGAAELRARVETEQAVWMLIHRGRRMWAARDAQGLFTSKDQAVAAQRRAAQRRAADTVRRAINLKW